MRMKVLLLLTAFIYSPSIFAENAKVISLKDGIDRTQHINAVGAVFTVDGYTASVGTGTFIGNNKILTAGHIFKAVLPKKVPQKSGPVTIDISKKRVFWSNEPILDMSVPPSKIYHAKSITVDAEFINNFHADIRNPDKDDVKCDLAVLTLDAPVSNTIPVELPELHTTMPDMGLLVGYGRRAEPNHKKRSHPQALHGVIDMGKWGIMMANLNKDIEGDHPMDTSKEEVHMEMLLGKENLSTDDVVIARATQGDSGGPLLIVDDDNKVRIIGIMSANSAVFNAFASLLVKTPTGLFRNPNLEALVRAAPQ